MKKAELLAPAGSFDALRAAVSNGADAVYLGGKNFSARAYAANFDDEEMKGAVRYAHLRNVKIYVTVNTLLNEDELKAALDTCEKYYEYGVDALIIQDLGLYYALKQRHPDFDLHASTQMHIHNIEGIRTVKKLGFARTVVARESSLEFLKEACRQGIEIECFVHGAICVSYSGQCLLSSVTKSRSANRGMCAQCCRLRYDLLEDGRKIPTDTAYLLSPKDMYLLEDIPKLIEAGISSFKIEGRMKSPAYVAYVTRMYRKAIDAYYNKQQFTITEQEREELKVLFNRGFTDTYLKRSGEDLFGQERPNHLGIPIGEVVGRKGKQLLIRLSGTLRQFDGIRVVHDNNEEGMILNRLYRKENLISDAGKGETVAIDLKGDFRKGDPVYKTVDSALQKKLEDLPEKKIPVDLDITLYPDQEPVVKAYVDGHEYTYIHPEKPSAAMSHPLDEENIRKHFLRFATSVYEARETTIHTLDAFFPVSKINELRRAFLAFLDEARLNDFNRNAIEPDVVWQDLTSEEKGEKLIESYDGKGDFSLVTPINDGNRYGRVIADAGGLLEDRPDKIAYYTLNVMNSIAYECLKRLGFDKIILSTEMNEMTVKRLMDAYRTRTGKEICPYVLRHGRRPLMYLKRDPAVKYRKPGHDYALSDGTFLLEMRDDQGITELIETWDGGKEIPDTGELIIIRNEKDREAFL